MNRRVAELAKQEQHESGIELDLAYEYRGSNATCIGFLDVPELRRGIQRCIDHWSDLGGLRVVGV